MTRNPKLRSILAVVLGACAGSSLCLSILPLALYQAGIGEESTLALLLSQYMVYVALVWAVGGWAVSRTRAVVAGGVTLGITGLASAILVVAMALQATAKIIVVGGVAGLVYGFLGGLLLARVLTPPPADEEGDT